MRDEDTPRQLDWLLHPGQAAAPAEVGRHAARGPIRKMTARPGPPVEYALPIGETSIAMNPLIGTTLRLAWTGRIECLACGRETRKSYGQGHCYPCFTRLARCDSCMVKPELCHYARGSCREPEWGEQHCLIPHTVYLANSSGLKVGITRGLDPTTRWIDQGATQAMPIRIVSDRLEAGQVELSLKRYVADKTNWRDMLRGEPEPIDLPSARDRLFEAVAAASPSAAMAGQAPDGSEVSRLEYPVRAYPEKIRSHDLDRSPVIEGTLDGIKGQYLIFDGAVINIRKYGGYVIELSPGRLPSTS